MTTKDAIEKRLEELRLEYRKVSSMLSMMEKGTKTEDLAKMHAQQMDPVRREIKRLEGELAFDGIGPLPRLDCGRGDVDFLKSECHIPLKHT